MQAEPVVFDVPPGEFEQKVLAASAERPVVVDFWAEWCAPCRQISPIIHALAETYGDRVSFVKMNIDENPNTPGRYGVRAIPTVLSLKGGEVVQQITGARPKKAFEEMVEKLLG